MLNPERKARSKPANNFYVPPPARRQEGSSSSYALSENRTKDRVQEAKLKNAAEETKICNNSSLLFKADEESPRSSSVGDPSAKKKRRRKKKSLSNEIQTDTSIADPGTSSVDPESSSQRNAWESDWHAGIDNYNTPQSEYLDEASGITYDDCIMDATDDFEIDVPILSPNVEVLSPERYIPTLASDLNPQNHFNHSPQPESYWSDDDNMADTEDKEKSCVEESVNKLQTNNSADEACQTENFNTNSTNSFESSALNIFEERRTVKTKAEQQYKKPTSSRNTSSKGNTNKRASEKRCVAKRSVEVYENNNLCANFRNSESQSKLSPGKSEDVSASAEDEDDFEWEKLLDEDFKNLRVTTVFRDPDEESPKKSMKASYWEDEHNDSSIIEIYGFPEEFKTQDLLISFATFANRGFKLKWVDNTHALGIFPTPSIANEALEAPLPFVRTRPLSQATTPSKEKAKHIVLPSALRPKTCSALARRLVSGALGVRAVFTPAEREAERELLKQAREQKRLAAKQRDAAWEGKF